MNVLYVRFDIDASSFQRLVEKNPFQLIRDGTRIMPEDPLTYEHGMYKCARFQTAFGLRETYFHSGLRLDDEGVYLLVDDVASPTLKVYMSIPQQIINPETGQWEEPRF
jgi:hypothetical protein